MIPNDKADRIARLDRMNRRKDIEAQLKKEDRIVFLEGAAADVLTAAEFSRRFQKDSPGGTWIKALVSWKGKPVAAVWNGPPGLDSRLMFSQVLMKARADLTVLLSRLILEGREHGDVEESGKPS